MNDLDTRLNAIYALDDIGHFDKALEKANALVAEQPHQARALAAQAWTLDKCGQLDAAQASLDAARALDPTQADVRWVQICLDEERQILSVPQAITLLRALLQDVPDHALAMNSLGYYLMHAGQMTEAEQVLRQVIALHPDRIRPQHNLQFLISSQGRSDDEYRNVLTPEAIAAYVQRARLDPMDGQASYDAGTALYHLGRHVEAQPHLDNARRLWGEDNAIQHNRALNLFELARRHEKEDAWDQAFACYREAIAEWDSVLQREPDWDWAIDGRINALFFVAHAHWLRGELDQALAVVDPLAAQDCPNPRVLEHGRTVSHGSQSISRSLAVPDACAGAGAGLELHPFEFEPCPAGA